LAVISIYLFSISSLSLLYLRGRNENTLDRKEFDIQVQLLYTLDRKEFDIQVQELDIYRSTRVEHNGPTGIGYPGPTEFEHTEPTGIVS
jgi:hypothetical protein